VTVQVRPAPDTGPESTPNLSFRLGQSSPNPFHTSTTIAFANPARAPGTLAVYDVQGKRVATLLDGVVDAGEYSIRWNGADDSGKLLAPGVYVYRLRIGNHESVKKLAFSH
jgi:flagellar hook assembly protein FlgD